MTYTCIFHGLPVGEHVCLVCAMCYKDLTPDECSYEPDGTRVDVCVPCRQHELNVMTELAKRYNSIAATVRGFDRGERNE